MKKQNTINYDHPKTRKLAEAVRCMPPENPDPIVKDIVDAAMVRIRQSFSLVTRLSFSLLTLHEPSMRLRLSSLATEYLADHPDAEKKDVVTWLIGERDSFSGSFFLSSSEERILIKGIQDKVPYALEIFLQFLALKAIPAIRPHMYGIDANNREDIEAACNEVFYKAILKFDLEKFPMGLAYDIVKFSLPDAVMEEIGLRYPATFHRGHILLLNQLHQLMKDKDFADLPIEKRAKIAKATVELVLLYDIEMADKNLSTSGGNGISSDIDVAGTYDTFDNCSSIRSAEDMDFIEYYDRIKAAFAEPVICECLETLRYEIVKYKTPKTQLDHGIKALEKVKERYVGHFSEESWDAIMSEVKFCAYLLARNTTYFKGYPNT